MTDEIRYLPEPMFAFAYDGGLYHLRYDTKEGKSMPWAEKAENGRFYVTRKPIPDMPYLRIADKCSDLFIVVEGEKCVDAVFQRLKFNALTGNKGGDYWREAFSAPLAGKNVIIIPDNDETGKSYAEKAFASLETQAASVRVFLPWEWWEDIGAKEDIYDAISKHGEAEVREKLLGFIEGEIPPQREHSETTEHTETLPAWPMPYAEKLPPSFLVSASAFSLFHKMTAEQVRTAMLNAVNYFLTGEQTDVFSSEREQDCTEFLYADINESLGKYQNKISAGRAGGNAKKR